MPRLTAAGGVLRLRVVLSILIIKQHDSYFVLGFWDKNTGICAGAIPYRRDFPATTGIWACQADVHGRRRAMMQVYNVVASILWMGPWHPLHEDPLHSRPF